jgi:DNA-binding response OmpR family regulator
VNVQRHDSAPPLRDRYVFPDVTENRPIALVIQPSDLDDTGSLFNLEADGVITWHASTGNEARLLIGAAREANLRPDIIIVNRDLSDVDGLVFCAFVRRVSDARVVLCGPRDSTDRTLAYRLGVDAFVSAPVVADELIALIAHLQTANRPSTIDQTDSPDTCNLLEFGSLQIDDVHGSVRVGKNEVWLTRTQYRLLLALARCAPAAASRAQLGRDVWNRVLDLPQSLIDNHITRLRAQLIKAGGGAPSIVAVPGVGYRLCLPC